MPAGSELAAVSYRRRRHHRSPGGSALMTQVTSLNDRADIACLARDPLEVKKEGSALTFARIFSSHDRLVKEIGRYELPRTSYVRNLSAIGGAWRMSRAQGDSER